MSKKAKVNIICAVMILAVIICAVTAIAYINKTTIDSVSHFGIKSSDVHSQSLRWTPVKKAMGYNIYLYTPETKEYTKILTVENGKEKNSVVGNLEQATPYYFSITAYKTYGNKIIESEKSNVLTAYTLPEQSKIESLISINANQAIIFWFANPSGSGYELQYSQEQNFKTASELQFNDPSEIHATIDGLSINAVYYFRSRAKLDTGSKMVYGAWSEPCSVTISDVQKPPIDPTKPMVALTFDDGPDYGSSSNKILDVLEKYNARATFFMVGENAKNNPENVQRKISLGCEIGNHTYNHKHYGKEVTANDIKKGTKAIQQACGQVPTCFRSTGGKTTKAIRDECRAEGMPIYYWSLDTEDWKTRDEKKIYKKVIKNVKDGDIILMHEIYPTTAKAIEKIVPKLISQGYQLVTCEELMVAKTGAKGEPGTQYVSATQIKNNTN